MFVVPLKRPVPNYTLPLFKGKIKWLKTQDPINLRSPEF
jgi:hypothetical protein